MPEQRLWAPWRLAYMRAERPEEGCIFCLAAAAGDDAARLVLERCFAMLNAFSYRSGHPMVAPVRHVGSVEDLDAGELLELMTIAQRGLRDESRPTDSTSASTRARSRVPASPGTCTCTWCCAGRPTTTSWP